MGYCQGGRPESPIEDGTSSAEGRVGRPRPPEQRMDLSVVIPAYDEQDNIAPLVEEVWAALPAGLRCEVVCVDDGSTDRTAERVRARIAGGREIRLLRHKTRYGQSAAIVSGVRAARGRWIVTLDGDGQNVPADIAVLLERRDAAGPGSPIRLVMGWRVERRDGPMRRASSRIANAVRRRVLRDDTPDSGCGLRLFSREVFLALPVFDHMHRFLPALVKHAGWEVVSVPVRHRPRMRGRSSYGVQDRLWSGIVDVLGVGWLRKREIHTELRDGRNSSNGSDGAGP